MESECRMQRRKPLGEKILEKIRGNPALPSEKKFKLFLNSHQRKPRHFSKAQNGAESTVLGYEKKPGSKEINLKYHIRFLKPVYHRKIRIRQKNCEIQGTQPCPAGKNSQYFWITISENPAFFQNPKTAPKLQFSIFLQKKKRKKQTRIKRKRGWNPLYWKTREQRNFKRVLYGRFGMRHNFSKNCPQDPKMG